MAFTIVRYATERFGERQGVATSWLNALCAPLASSRSGAGGGAADGGAVDGAPANGNASAPTSPIRLPIFLRRGGAFGPPDSLATPLVMIGPGTGVAPFRGFLQHRRAQAAAQGAGGEGGAADSKGAAWLFFGCRREDQDFLYKDDLQASVGILQCCCTCSRWLLAYSCWRWWQLVWPCGWAYNVALTLSLHPCPASPPATPCRRALWRMARWTGCAWPSPAPRCAQAPGVPCVCPAWESACHASHLSPLEIPFASACLCRPTRCTCST